jgi:hypothetical protein
VAALVKPVLANGVLFDDVWEESVLEHFKLELYVATAPHCPIMGAQEDFFV